MWTPSERSLIFREFYNSDRKIFRENQDGEERIYFLSPDQFTWLKFAFDFFCSSYILEWHKNCVTIYVLCSLFSVYCTR